MTEQEFWEILAAMPLPKPIFFRAYYNDEGIVVCYTMEDLPGNYIEIDQETYSRGPVHARIINNKLVEIKPSTVTKKLKPTVLGTSCDPRDICIIVLPSAPHTNWSFKTNETRV